MSRTCIFRSVLAFGGLLLLSVPLARADYRAGWEAWRRGDFGRALGEFEAAAVDGDQRAAVALADLYSSGRGVPMDMAEAMRWRGHAAEAGHTGAQFALGSAYLAGDGVAKDVKEAERWLECAARQGHPNAQLALGRILLEDSTRAAAGVAWVRRAADAGLLEASLTLADAYERGAGVERDPRRAAELRADATSHLDQAARAQAAEAQRQIAESTRDKHWRTDPCRYYAWYHHYPPYYTPYRSHFGFGIFHTLP